MKCVGSTIVDYNSGFKKTHRCPKYGWKIMQTACNNKNRFKYLHDQDQFGGKNQEDVDFLLAFLRQILL